MLVLGGFILHSTRILDAGAKLYLRWEELGASTVPSIPRLLANSSIGSYPLDPGLEIHSGEISKTMGQILPFAAKVGHWVSRSTIWRNYVESTVFRAKGNEV